MTHEIEVGALVRDRAGFYWRVVAKTPSGVIYARGPALALDEPIAGQVRPFGVHELRVITPTAESLAVVIL